MGESSGIASESGCEQELLGSAVAVLQSETISSFKGFLTGRAAPLCLRTQAGSWYSERNALRNLVAFIPLEVEHLVRLLRRHS